MKKKQAVLYASSATFLSLKIAAIACVGTILYLGLRGTEQDKRRAQKIRTNKYSKTPEWDN